MAKKTTRKKKPRKTEGRIARQRDAGRAAETSAVSGEPQAASPCVIVGVGASAGGLEAFTTLLHALPPDPGFAMVLVQHLAPQHESALPALLAGRTNLTVVQATEGIRVEPDRVYVIPPNVQMGIRGSRLHLNPRPSDRSQYTPIDFFLRTLAESAQTQAIAVILSGTASDGTIGVREVKAVGGITIAQQPETARYDGMPRAAIATGFIDLVLPPERIASELVRISRHPLVRAARASLPKDHAEDGPPPTDGHLEEIFKLLRTASGVDFRRYKRPTIERRLHRRMVLHRLPGIDQYLKLLRESPAEVQELYQDILIHVTRFFREPESFVEIAANVLPKLLESRHEEEAMRVWVPGCSTGEEAYSIAIVVMETLGEQAGSIPVQIFATDVSEQAIEHARMGVYSAAIASDVSVERLRRFFTRADGGYRINKVVRDVCVFARQDLTRDPPFSRLDLIVCRNVLIYMGVELQQKLMGVFHYALKANGFLVLGAAETIGVRSDLFSVADKKHRIYAKKHLTAAPDRQRPPEYTMPAPFARREPPPPREDAHSVGAEANRVIQDLYAPPGVVVDANLHIVQFRGQTGGFLEPAPGDPSHSVLKMAREGLLHGLRGAIQDARRTGSPARKSGLRVRSNGGWHVVDVDVVPLLANERPHYLILFSDVARARHAPRQSKSRRTPTELPRGPLAHQVGRLQEELASSREYLQSIIQELEGANEELQSANEEVLSANEELQSTNEELDTAKEELQSTNEELNTVNEELHGRNEELSRLNSDLMNLLGSVQIAIVITSADLRIRRFTPMAERVLNLLPGDVGRPIGHIKPNIECPDLEEEIARVIDNVVPVERRVKDRQGNVFSMRIRPYKSVDNRIDGAVLALFDLDETRRSEDAVRSAREFAGAIVDVVRQPVALLDKELRVQMMNPAFAEVLGIEPGTARGRLLHELGDGRWSDARTRLEALVERRDAAIESFEVGGNGRMLLHARRIPPGFDGDVALVVSLDEQRDGRRGS